MAALDFPSSPADNEIFRAPNGATWKWDNTRGLWISVGGTAKRRVSRFTGIAGDDTLSVVYNVGQIDVYYNGVKLDPNTDFTATNGTSVVLTDAVADDSDIIETIAWSNFDITEGLDITEGDARYLKLAGGTMTGDITMGDNDVLGTKTISYNAEYDNGNSGTSKTITLTNGQKQKITLDNNTTLTFDATSAGTGHYQVRLIQDGTGSRTLTISGISSTQWLNSASTPSINSAANGQTLINIFVAGSTIICASMSKIGSV